MTPSRHFYTVLCQLPQSHCIGPWRNFSTSPCFYHRTMRIRSTEDVLQGVDPGTDDVPVIRFPAAMALKMGRALDLKQQNETREKEARWSQAKQRLLIQSNRKDRNFYAGQSTNKFEAPQLASMTWKGKRSVGDHFTIRPSGNNPAMRDCDTDPVPGFDKFQLHEAVMDALEERKLTVCTNIQNQAIPMILQGDNVICAAETGSGKTLAYLVPLVDKLAREDDVLAESKSARDRARVNTPRALILTPSRELAYQIYEVLAKLIAFTRLNAEVIIGGERTQWKLNNPTYSSTDILISTPGVLSKLLTNKLQNLSAVHTVVVDEADTMVDDSFSDIVRRLMNRIDFQGGGSEEEGTDIRGAQLILVGATMPTSLNDTFDGLVPMASLTRVSTQHLHRVSPHIRQTFHRTRPSQKPPLILEMVKEQLKAGQTLMIFCHDSKTCDWLSQFLQEHGVDAPRFNGAMMQRYRRGLFEQFQRGDFRCLVCTDIASRGLDTTNVTHVINYDFPNDISDYIHRCGRTGRLGANAPGRVSSFVTYPGEVAVVQKIEHAVRQAAQLTKVNHNITRRISLEKGMDKDDLRAMGKRV